MACLSRWFAAIVLSGMLAGCQMQPALPSESPELAGIKAAVSEPAAWEIAKSTHEAAVLEDYLARFSGSEHGSIAALRLKLIRKGAIQ